MLESKHPTRQLSEALNTKPERGRKPPKDTTMTIVFSSIHQHECFDFLDSDPNGNFILEKNIFTGRWNVLDAS